MSGGEDEETSEARSEGEEAILSMNICTSSEGENPSNDEVGNENENLVIQSEGFVQSKSKCKCRGGDSKLLKKLLSRNLSAAGLKSDMDCLATLRKIMKSKQHGGDLTHVCYTHLHALGRHFGLQVKKLKTPTLRSRLRLIWDHRLNLNEFKLSHPQWCRLLRRPEVPDDLHGVFAQRVVRDNMELDLSEAKKQIILDKIAGLKAWGEVVCGWEFACFEHVQVVVGRSKN